jgi:hypothetical protein
MVVRLLASSTDTRRNKSNNHAKFAVTPHWRSAVLVEYITQRFHQKLGGIRVNSQEIFAQHISDQHHWKKSNRAYRKEMKLFALIYNAGVSLKTLQRMSPMKEQ